MQKRVSCKFLPKKGTISIRQSIIHLGMIVLAVFAALLLWDYVGSIGNNTDFEMLFLSRDMSLLLNAIHSAPGDVEYFYSSDKISPFSFDFKPLSQNENQAAIIRFESISKNYPYAKSSPGKELFSINAPKSIKFSKKNGQVSINKNE